MDTYIVSSVGKSSMIAATVKIRDIEDFIEDEALMLCNFCAEYVKATNELEERKKVK